MLMIRLQRTGKKHSPQYRVVLIDSRRAARSGSALDILGSYNPRSGERQLKADKIKEWLSKGAQVSETVNNFLVDAKIIEGKKKDVLHHKKIKAKIEKNKSKEEKKPEPAAVVAPESAPMSEEPAPAPEEPVPVAEEKAEQPQVDSQ